jgi:penicillin-binding protein 1A
MGKYIFQNKYISVLSWLSLAGICGSTLLFAGLYLYLSPKLPAVETLRQVKLQTPLRIYSRDDRLIGEFGEKRRYPIAYKDIPQYYIDAILAAEDDQFYAHNGVSIKGLMRAASQLLQSGHIQTGGSTITMQVARNFFLTRNQTFARKFNEILLALQIEQKLSKAEILELYVNKIYLGNRAYGIQASANVYYGKGIDELSLAQLAMIAGLPKAPSAYNPIANPSRALIRRDWILDRMLELGYIGSDEFNAAKAEAVTASYHGSPLDLQAPYIAEQARKEAIQLLGKSAYTEGYRVYTTVDSTLQDKAQSSIVTGLLDYDHRHGYRGPEETLPPLTMSPESTAEATQLYAEWLAKLKKLPDVAGLKAAAVTAVHSNSIDVLLADSSDATLNWEDGLSTARRYLSENRRSAAPKTAADIAAVGDIIRIEQTDSDGENTWRLRQIPAAQAALVSLNPENGAILSMVGGFDFQQSHFNRVIQAARQPGSNFKPFIYSTALEHGFTSATIMNDAPIVFDDSGLETAWRPENASGKFFGPTRLRQALYKSRNLVSIRVLRGIGIDNALSGLERFGFDTSEMPRVLSLALGSHALTPLQIATGYAVFANGGFRVKPFLIDSIEDVDGKSIYLSQPLTVCRDCDNRSNYEENPVEVIDTETLEKLANNETTEEAINIVPADIEFVTQGKDLPSAPRVLDPRVAYIIDSMLRDVVQHGTGRRARALGRTDIAGKTGTTNGPRDAWFSGYSPSVITTTWLGFDRNTPLGRNEYGGSAALPIWLDYMQLALIEHPEVPKQQPDGLVTVRIDPATGLRAQPGSSNAIFEIFRAGNEPQLIETEAMAIDGNSVTEELPEEIF